MRKRIANLLVLGKEKGKKRIESLLKPECGNGK